MAEHGLGRLYFPDARDAEHSVRKLLEGKPRSTRNHRYWYSNGWWGDQGSTSQCVAYAWVHWLEDGPTVQRSGPPPIVSPQVLYDRAQQVDEWPGEDYDGTSVRAGAKVLQSMGFVAQYNWAFTVNEVIDTLLTLGPMTVGTNWYDSMFTPGADNFIRVVGSVAGGHAYKLDGVNVARKCFRVKNSWGREWGNAGYALISFGDFERLLREDGEACIAKEVEK